MQNSISSTPQKSKKICGAFNAHRAVVQHVGVNLGSSHILVPHQLLLPASPTPPLGNVIRGGDTAAPPPRKRCEKWPGGSKKALTNGGKYVQ